MSTAQPLRVALGASYTARRALVLGDAHFDPTDALQIEQLASFVRAQRAELDLLVILGDLFDYWVGPKHLRIARVESLRGAIAEARERGMRCAFVPGNRDFLFDRGTAEAFGCEHAGEWVDLHVGADRWLLTHGDALCLEDAGYMRLRRITHAPLVRWLSRALPLWVLRGVAKRLRAASRRSQARRRASAAGTTAYARAFPIRPPAVQAACEQHGSFTGLICGHVHVARCWVDEDGRRFLSLPAFEREEGHLVLEAGSPPRFFAGGERLAVEARHVARGSLTFE